MRIAKHWPAIEKYATSAHLTLRDAIVGLTRVGAGDILEDFPEDYFRMPELQEPLALPSDWVPPSLPPGTEVSAAEVLQPVAPSAITRSVETNLARTTLVERIKKVVRALENAIEKYEEVALTVKDLTFKKQAVQVASEFTDVDTAFATLADHHRQVAAAITVLDGYARAQKAAA